jgi:hypothetical protein
MRIRRRSDMMRCDESIDALGLTTRTRNCLRRKGIRTKEQLMSLDDRELLEIRGFGVGCLVEIRQKLGGPTKIERKRKEPITLAKAIGLVENEYESAKKLGHIRNPIAYALYKVWKIADQEAEDV